jgi:hypothetical protein
MVLLALKTVHNSINLVLLIEFVKTAYFTDKYN